MPRFDRAKARQTPKRPGIEALEARKLLANLPLPPIPSGASLLNLPAVQYAFSQLYDPSNPKDNITEANGTTITSPQPSVQEVHREFLEFKGSANYTVTAPRFVSTQAGVAGQLETIHAAGIYGSSNQFLWGRPQLLLFPSANPSMPATGLVTITAANYTQSGAFAILDLTEAPLTASGQVDPNGIVNGEIIPTDHFQRTASESPEVFTWKLDAASSTLYTGTTGNTPNPAYAAIVNPIYAQAAATHTAPQLPEDLPPAFLPGPTESGMGAGVLNLSYLPAKQPASGTTESGDVRITAMGLTNVPGTNNTAAENFS